MDVQQLNFFHQIKTDRDAGQRRRVEKNISTVVLEFCKQRLRDGNFHFIMTDLEQYVNKQHPITPGSAGRILRGLKRTGKIQYDVKDRSKALYSIWTVSTEEAC
jgi:hypothetical protein